jgi:hypothetical protein
MSLLPDLNFILFFSNLKLEWSDRIYKSKVSPKMKKKTKNKKNNNNNYFMCCHS